MGLPEAREETLAERASSIRDSLRKSQAVTDEMVALLGSFDHRLSALDAAIRPSQARAIGIMMAAQNIDRALKSADVAIGQYDLCRQVEAVIVRGPDGNLKAYLEVIDVLRSNAEVFRSTRSSTASSGVLSHANNLLAMAASKLEDEFRHLLREYSKPLDPGDLFACLPSSLQGGDSKASSTSNHSEHQNKGSALDVYKPLVLIPPRILPLLHDLAQQLVQARLQLQCSKIYSEDLGNCWPIVIKALPKATRHYSEAMRLVSRESRSFALEESLRKLGVETIIRDDVHIMEWKDLEAKIRNWIFYIRIAVKLLFVGERRVCDQVFESIDPLREQTFSAVILNSLKTLIGFGEAVAKSNRAPEKLFTFLDMYETMHELQSEFETIFEDKACSEMRESALHLTIHLVKTVQETLDEFEEAIKKDASKNVSEKGEVHRLTSYVINYVKLLVDYRSVLNQLFHESRRKDEPRQLETVVTCMLQALLSNLDVKSKLYNDTALSHIFLMNNLHYMVISVRRSEAKEILGDDWIQRHRRTVQQNANKYKRVAWTKILQTLAVQSLTSSGGITGGSDGGGNSSGVSKETVKERFKAFNMQFEDLHFKHAQWIVPDTELRELLRLAIAEVLLPAYGSFIKRLGPLVESGRNRDRYVKYAPEDLDRMLGDLFEGKSYNDQRR